MARSLKVGPVSIHASAREATMRTLSIAGCALSFNPRLRTGGDLFPARASAARNGVSIHASAREATPPGEAGLALFRCFNPRLRTGGDFARVLYCGGRCRFQSTPPHGRRRASPASPGGTAQVSIHASAREATPPAASPGWRLRSFNPRLRTGGDCDRRWPARLKDLRV